MFWLVIEEAGVSSVEFYTLKYFLELILSLFKFILAKDWGTIRLLFYNPPFECSKDSNYEKLSIVITHYASSFAICLVYRLS
jgi:hypothetical protein